MIALVLAGCIMTGVFIPWARRYDQQQEQK
jgi:hypothetical protein